MEKEKARLMAELARGPPTRQPTQPPPPPPPPPVPGVTAPKPQFETPPRQPAIGVPQLSLQQLDNPTPPPVYTPRTQAVFDRETRAAISGLRSEMRISPEAEARIKSRASKGQVDQRLSKLKGLIDEIKK